MRDEFEKWAAERFDLQRENFERTDALGLYCNNRVDDLWKGYQAGRRAGAEAMREEAAKTAARMTMTLGHIGSGGGGGGTFAVAPGGAHAAGGGGNGKSLSANLAEAIRALPLDEGGK